MRQQTNKPVVRAPLNQLRLAAPSQSNYFAVDDRLRVVRQRTHEFLKSRKKTIEDVAQAANLPADRLKDWLANDKKQLDLGEQSPVMKVIGLRDADLPEIMVHDFRKNGYLPEVLLNFLALLGWSPGGDREQMSVQEMVGRFTLEGVGAYVVDVDERAYSVRAMDASCTAQAPPPPTGVTYVKGGMTFSPSYATQAPYVGQDDEPSMRTDKFGNEFRQKGQVGWTDGAIEPVYDIWLAFKQ